MAMEWKVSIVSRGVLVIWLTLFTLERGQPWRFYVDATSVLMFSFFILAGWAFFLENKFLYHLLERLSLLIHY